MQKLIRNDTQVTAFNGDVTVGTVEHMHHLSCFLTLYIYFKQSFYDGVAKNILGVNVYKRITLHVHQDVP